MIYRFFLFSLFSHHACWTWMHIHINSIDEDEEPHCVQLTNQHKAAIRFIRKVNAIMKNIYYFWYFFSHFDDKKENFLTCNPRIISTLLFFHHHIHSLHTVSLYVKVRNLFSYFFLRTWLKKAFGWFLNRWRFHRQNHYFVFLFFLLFCCEPFFLQNEIHIRFNTIIIIAIPLVDPCPLLLNSISSLLPIRNLK